MPPGSGNLIAGPGHVTQAARRKGRRGAWPSAPSSRTRPAAPRASLLSSIARPSPWRACPGSTKKARILAASVLRIEPRFIAVRARIAPEQRAPPAPAAAGQIVRPSLRCGDKISAVSDQHCIDAEGALKSAVDLLRRNSPPRPVRGSSARSARAAPVCHPQVAARRAYFNFAPATA